MNRYILQALTLLAFVPLIILAGSIFIVVLPIILSGMTYNAFNYNRMKEFYTFLVLTFVSILIALSLLGVL
jgi:MFS superfamily sulfate permease-like transporter|tara:strand:- start:121 stop:333 length:213 start_codon:yes stop_codon:yes gene_type:complete